MCLGRPRVPAADSPPPHALPAPTLTGPLIRSLLQNLFGRYLLRGHRVGTGLGTHMTCTDEAQVPTRTEFIGQLTHKHTRSKWNESATQWTDSTCRKMGQQEPRGGNSLQSPCSRFRSGSATRRLCCAVSLPMSLRPSFLISQMQTVLRATSRSCYRD